MRGFGGGGKSYLADDEILGKVYDHQLMKRLGGYARPYYWIFILSVLLVLLSTVCFLAGPRLIGLIIDEGVKPKNIPALTSFVLLYLAVTLLRWLISYISTYTLAYLGQKIMYDLRMQVFAHLQKMSLRFFDKNPVGRLITRTTSDISALSELFSVGLVTVMGDFLMIVGLIVVMLWLNLHLALTSLAVALLLIPVIFAFKSLMRNTYREIRRKIAHLNAYLAENISGIRVTHLFNREAKNLVVFKEINQDLYQSTVQSVIYDGLFVPSVTVLGAIAISLVLYYGGGMVVQKAIELGILVTFINYTMHFFDPIRDLADKYTIFQAAMASAERVFKILDTPEEVADSPTAISLKSCRGEIRFENVWFAYENENYVLKDVSFTVAPGESVALVGLTGSGKSTIINLLCRFYDIQKGRILLDGIDLKTIRQTDLRRQMGIVLQDVFLFSGNIMDNIRLGEKGISPDLCHETATYVNAHTFIEKLPAKYESSVTERGMTFSIGQRQLLSFARALAFNPSILILDEATSSVDVETEHYIQEAIRKLIKDKTSIIIAHRLSTIQNVDKIIVVHKGEIKEVGRHRELLAQRGIYYKLYQLQYQTMNNNQMK